MATNEDFYRLVEAIPFGKVATYGMIALKAGSPGGGQAVGTALRNRSLERNLPWHRVVNGDGKMGKLSPLAPQTQRALLEQEGIAFDSLGRICLETYGWQGAFVQEVSRPLTFGDLSNKDLLRLYAEVTREIQSRGLSRGLNHPQADLAEQIVAKALKAAVQTQSNAGFDLLDEAGVRYEVKSRRLTGKRGDRQLSAIRDLDRRKFDYLVGVLFNEDCTVNRAVIVPWEVVRTEARYVPHTNSWLLNLNDSVWSIAGVRDLDLSSVEV